MQKRTKFFLAGAAVSLIGLTAIGGAIGNAVAGHKHHDRGMGMHGGGMGMHGGHRGMRERGGHRRHGMRHRIKQFAKRYDTDKNGEISQQEIDTNRTDWHKKYDADGNGTIDLKEFEALWLEAKRLQMAREFQRIDEDASGSITLEEYTEPMSRMVERMDRNGDGVLSRKDMRHRRMHRKRGHGGMQMPKKNQEESTDSTE